MLESIIHLEKRNMIDAGVLVNQAEYRMFREEEIKIN